MLDIKNLDIQYKSDLLFTKNILSNMNIHFDVFGEPFTNLASLDGGIRRHLFIDSDYADARSDLINTAQPNVLYRITDEFLCNYVLFLLPHTKERCVGIIGPYLYEIPPLDVTAKALEKIGIPGENAQNVLSYYETVPSPDSEIFFYGLLNALGSAIWDGPHNFSIEYRDLSEMDEIPLVQRDYDVEQDDAFLRMRQLESRYEIENNMLNSITKGEIHQAEMFMNQMFISSSVESRQKNPIRNIKNYAIVTGALFRKAAEAGHVHPIHIDRVSADFAKKIEAASSEDEVTALLHKTLRKYCFLVQNYSMEGYSMVIRKAITLINADLTADLSLSNIASILNVNSSYLSTLFKNETSYTLTEYVTQARIKNAIFLLNSTTLQISTIAAYCGIPDVQYFSKIFKKRIGVSPTDYKKMISK